MANPDVLPPEDGDDQFRSEAMQSPETSALAKLNQSEYIAMCELARKYPRSLKHFDDKIMRYANHSAEVALSMFYSLPRANKRIIGPSVRFAEILVPSWQNCAAGARDMDSDETTTSAQGIFFDFENRVKISIEVSRRITDSNGRRYNADMIQTTAAAATSIAYRNSIFRGVPRALWLAAYGQAQLTAVGKAKSFAESVAIVMDRLFKRGITEWQILNTIGVTSAKDIDRETLCTLSVLDKEIGAGEKTVEELFGSEYDKEIEKIFDQLKYNDTQRRMLRDNHMGRARELVEYLRKKIDGGASTTPIETTHTEKGSKKKAKTEEAKTEPKPPEEPKTEPKKEPEPEPEKPADPPPQANGAPKPQRDFHF